MEQKILNQAVLNLYMYLIKYKPPANYTSLENSVRDIERAFLSGKLSSFSQRDETRLKIIKAAIDENPALSKSKITSVIVSRRGLSACSFLHPDGEISVVFKGTGSGEWLDNGEGLSGICTENTYVTYEDGAPHYNVVPLDYATDQQVEALNWFNTISAQNGWDEKCKITVSGHSKGGNKAQFIAIYSPLCDTCISFNGQGFSPEAINLFKNSFSDFEERRRKIFSISADNDYVNVLGARLMNDENISYVKSRGGLHHMDALFSLNGRLNPPCAQGRLSSCVAGISNELMQIKAPVRKYATLGVMNVFQKYLARDDAIGGEGLSIEKTIAGLAIAAFSVLRSLDK